VSVRRQASLPRMRGAKHLKTVTRLAGAAFPGDFQAVNIF
jgi:hypothetical protein